VPSLDSEITEKASLSHLLHTSGVPVTIFTGNGGERVNEIIRENTQDTSMLMSTGTPRMLLNNKFARK
jgi:hypothetical protein